MLDIQYMSEKDKVFYFVEELKSWTLTKLYAQKVQDLASVLAATQRLLDYSGDQQSQKNNMITLNLKI